MAALVALWPAVALAAEGAGGGGTRLAFRVFAAIAILTAVVAVTRRNPVIAVLWLVATLSSVGAVFLTLHATFLAAVQVLVYAGAIMVLFIFVVMSVGHPEREQVGLRHVPLSKAAALVAGGYLVYRLVRAFGGPGVPGPAAVGERYGDIREIGRLLFSDYLFPFEAISVLLLAAIVAAVVITRRPDRRSPAGDAEEGR